MKRLALLLIISSSIFIISFTHFEETKPVKSESIAVVELFTSQGCSSCPAADAVLSKIAGNDNVFALSYHVSYWNYLGWKDPYSSEEFTKRQRKYGSHFKLNAIYTPQMIVNGKYEFVGSYESKLNNALNKIDLDPISISISDLKVHSGKLTFSYSLDKQPTNLLLNAAIVERHVENYVPRGENHGKTLKHDNVVRSLKAINADDSGSLSIELSEFTSKEKLLILYLQDEKSLEVKGAVKTKI
ncbi:MAG: DUF1223 domain-containing protein [Fulvivirga sp.]|uniref:DUF1223 domain-containing protein n=1 Tax=Fulvivirga sp. TaxID=1931237 RepID=UPI0032EB2AA7